MVVVFRRLFPSEKQFAASVVYVGVSYHAAVASYQQLFFGPFAPHAQSGHLAAVVEVTLPAGVAQPLRGGEYRRTQRFELREDYLVGHIFEPYAAAFYAKVVIYVEQLFVAFASQLGSGSVEILAYGSYARSDGVA